MYDDVYVSHGGWPKIHIRTRTNKTFIEKKVEIFRNVFDNIISLRQSRLYVAVITCTDDLKRNSNKEITLSEFKSDTKDAFRIKNWSNITYKH